MQQKELEDAYLIEGTATDGATLAARHNNVTVVEARIVIEAAEDVERYVRDM
jgi:hypothetical protein